MKLILLEHDLTVCKLRSLDQMDTGSLTFFFLGKTEDEISLVCPTSDAPAPDDVTAREDGWRGFKIEGTLDFSLIGILAGISSVLAEAGVGIFAVSTYNTDYILVKQNDLQRAAKALTSNGYEFG